MRIRHLVGIAVLLIASMIPNPSKLEESNKYNVQSLLKDCGSALTTSRVFCLGYVRGVADHMFSIGETMADQYSRGALEKFDDRVLVTFFAACGSPASVGAMEQAFVNWAREHPKNWGMPLLDGVMMAIRETWPCDPEFREPRDK